MGTPGLFRPHLVEWGTVHLSSQHKWIVPHLASLEFTIPENSPKLRADARQNRDAILGAATRALAESGQISMNAIAQRAGVGNATLHRNFPTIEALTLAVYQHEVDSVAASASEYLAEHTADAALRLWIDRLARYAMTKRGLADALQAAAYSSDAHFAEVYNQIAGALTLLLEAAIEQGTVRAGTDPHDVLLALAGLWQMNPDSDWQQQARTLGAIVLRGIRD
ncbi:TetR/AcrR family transcriptional regulator [Mycetocola sp. BIGb0189]|uniref:TetR/AcrR family transcriptional regulator n=1 Tax=Mycetocola sp. BIGb0189 TaxID=2940604 RepID=UPI00216A40B4|nr:TetR/AcrR family transcriptional regulator [Mycetocola sp. BIGb0189]